MTSAKRNVPQPNPPLTLDRDGRTFVLHTNATIRQSVENITVVEMEKHTGPLDERLQESDVSSSLHTEASAESEPQAIEPENTGSQPEPTVDPHVQVVSESVLDLESNERETRCEVSRRSRRFCTSASMLNFF